ncbi:Creatininase [Burkholderiales bacterium]|jgi:creatinine amidohydrolase/Fe(II)-dependent formamide hydrolase-like protein|nr:Creatininase [Burkholderiales bacterium]
MPAARILAVAFCLGAGSLVGPAVAQVAAQVAAPPGTSVFLEDYTWTELRDAVLQGKTTAIVPIGGTEQSGPALALGKHNARVRLLSERIARELGNAIVAPVIAYVPEGSIAPPSSHMRFPGTLTIPNSVFDATLEAIARSLRVHGFRDIVFLGDHGGYQRDLLRVAEHLNREWSSGTTRAFAPVEYYRASSDGFARLLRARGFRDDEIGTHAGLADTALQLAVDPNMVRKDVLQSGRRLDESVGIYGGNPKRASAELGQLGLDEIVRQSVAAIRAQIGAAARGPVENHP